MPGSGRSLPSNADIFLLYKVFDAARCIGNIDNTDTADDDSTDVLVGRSSAIDSDKYFRQQTYATFQKQSSFI